MSYHCYCYWFIGSRMSYLILTWQQSCKDPGYRLQSSDNMTLHTPNACRSFVRSYFFNSSFKVWNVLSRNIRSSLSYSHIAKEKTSWKKIVWFRQPRAQYKLPIFLNIARFHIFLGQILITNFKPSSSQLVCSRNSLFNSFIHLIFHLIL